MAGVELEILSACFTFCLASVTQHIRWVIRHCYIHCERENVLSNVQVEINLKLRVVSQLFSQILMLRLMQKPSIRSKPVHKASLATGKSVSPLELFLVLPLPPLDLDASLALLTCLALFWWLFHVASLLNAFLHTAQ